MTRLPKIVTAQLAALLLTSLASAQPKGPKGPIVVSPEVTTFLGPMVGTVLLLILNDTVTRLTEYYGIVLGIVILFFAIGLRTGLMDFVVEWYARRRDGSER